MIYTAELNTTTDNPSPNMHLVMLKQFAKGNQKNSVLLRSAGGCAPQKHGDIENKDCKREWCMISENSSDSATRLV